MFSYLSFFRKNYGSKILMPRTLISKWEFLNCYSFENRKIWCLLRHHFVGDLQTIIDLWSLRFLNCPKNFYIWVRVDCFSIVLHLAQFLKCEYFIFIFIKPSNNNPKKEKKFTLKQRTNSVISNYGVLLGESLQKKKFKKKKWANLMLAPIYSQQNDLVWIKR